MITFKLKPETSDTAPDFDRMFNDKDLNHAEVIIRLKKCMSNNKLVADQQKQLESHQIL